MGNANCRGEHRHHQRKNEEDLVAAAAAAAVSGEDSATRHKTTNSSSSSSWKIKLFRRPSEMRRFDSTTRQEIGCILEDLRTPDTNKDTGDGNECKEQEHQQEDNDNNTTTYEDSMGDIFFDAVDSFSNWLLSSMLYPPTATSVIQSKDNKRRISMDEPETLLSQRNLLLQEEKASSEMIQDPREQHRNHQQRRRIPKNRNTNAAATTTTPPKEISLRASVINVTHHLNAETAGTQGRGYPGNLTPDELQACLQFRNELKLHRDAAYREIVYAYGPVEDEAFALCRFLRARQFDVNSVFDMLERNNVVELWNHARTHQFWQDLETEFACPHAVLMTLVPLIVSGVGGNGATVLYFQAGSINMDGVECIADLGDFVPYVWNFLYQEGKRSLEREAERHDTSEVTILGERIIVIDMKGIPSALFSSRGLDFIQKACQVPACFPEIINRMYMINAPFSFHMAWNVIKLALEKRSVQKTGFFSKFEAAKKDLLQNIDSKELLSDYGGTGPSFDHVFATRQREVGSHGRYVVELMSVSTSDITSITFELHHGEVVQSITVYTKSDKGAEFSICSSEGQEYVGETMVSRSEVGGGKRHYSVQLFCATTSDLPMKGPGTITVTAKGTAKDNFLLAVAIDN